MLAVDTFNIVVDIGNMVLLYFLMRADISKGSISVSKCISYDDNTGKPWE